jgi:hypothetical protein
MGDINRDREAGRDGMYALNDIVIQPEEMECGHEVGNGAMNIKDDRHVVHEYRKGGKDPISCSGEAP